MADLKSFTFDSEMHCVVWSLRSHIGFSLHFCTVENETGFSDHTQAESSWIVTDSPAIWADVGATHQPTRLEVLSRGLFGNKPQTRDLSTRLSSVAPTLLSVHLLVLGSSSETRKQPSQLSRRVLREQLWCCKKQYDSVTWFLIEPVNWFWLQG